MNRRCTLFLAIFAVLAQLALPTLHASSFAAKGGGLAFAVCGGSGSDVLLNRLRELAPPELLAELGLDVEQPIECGQCVTPVALAGPALALPSLPARAVAVHAVRPFAVDLGQQSPVRVRGPPLFQVSPLV